MISVLKFSKAPKACFLSTVRSRVNCHLKESGSTKNANSAMWIKAGVFIGSFFMLYGLIISGIFSPIVMLGLAIVLGACKAFVGFNVCHDAIHGSFSSDKNTNKLLSSIFHLLGANPYVWSITHNVVHHNFTNIPGHDEDIEVAPGLIRISRDEKVNKIQRFQHLYAFQLYGLASISWLLRKDFIKFFKCRASQGIAPHPKKEYFNLFFYKGLYIFLFVVLPLLVLDVTWWQFAIGFLAMHLAQGFTMGLVFQLAHVVEGTDFPDAHPTGTMEDQWAEHQMRTTANFATHNRFAAFFLGGLNRQIEHHLFPNICHIHYGEISKIVKTTAAEFNLPYIESPTFMGALKSHYRMLKKLGWDEARDASVSIPVNVVKA
ncbi:MAG: acyl-CoA desaturase [Flavobacterium sp.]|uniref:fatty acid desaturase family protein n=1 Tax=Flavobacterium sp. TaxID=239 RepID=UPI0011FEA76B|nr:acyl-CoA desaturase [Flavobacterium sp.]RZJ64212.1 MAG: acyl-CoA desaturase [Flavobacterium sp.]